MDQLLFHMVGIPAKTDSRVCHWFTFMAVCIDMHGYQKA